MSEAPRAMEARWQEFWAKDRTFRSERRPGRPKYYVLDMFPYPSGSGLHVGHPEGYTATDIIARYKRMCGFDVLHPMGWDAFGLPAEQYAIQTGTHPADTTQKNIAVFKRQLTSLGFSYDWEREINTTDEGYVRFTQWIFLQLFRRGLAFQSEIPVNWCQELGTVLANEEVIDGLSERGGYPVERRPLRQWQLRITEYADRLAEDLEGLDWPETAQKQRDWIGRSVGALVKFPLVDVLDEAGAPVSLEVFTTRPDTLFGATYMVVAPDHPLIGRMTTEGQRAEVEAYATRAAKKSDRERQAGKEKTGVFTGARAKNPVSGAEIPVYAADYVLGAYGTGAIMAVPAHDQRDFEFAQKFSLPVVVVVQAEGQELASDPPPTEAFALEGVAVNSGFLDGLSTQQAKERMLEHLTAQGLGSAKVTYKLRDWVFSRQRYWGEPIPIYFPVETSGNPRLGDEFRIDYETPIAVEESELPLRLPELEDYKPGDPAGALVKALEWRFFQKDGRWYARETNTMPQWAGSCWYYLRYLDPGNEKALFSQEAYDAWMPVDLYVGGAEHAVLHLLYARFWHKVLFDCGVVKHSEPFTRLVHQGMILGMVYRYFVDEAGKGYPGDSASIAPDKERGGFVDEPTGTHLSAQFLVEREIEMRDGKPFHPGLQVTLLPVAEKMSKARGNVVNPDDVVEEFGADTLRLYEMFMGPLEQVKPWQTSGLLGMRRFLDKVGAQRERCQKVDLSPETEKLLHRTIKKVTGDIEALRMNTAISTMMIYTNHLTTLPVVPERALVGLLQILNPFAPHLTEEISQELGLEWSLPADGGRASCLSLASWPVWDERLCVDDVVVVPVQLNGKVKTRIELPREATEEQAREVALSQPDVVKLLEGRPVRKFIFVPGRICNIIA